MKRSTVVLVILLIIILLAIGISIFLLKPKGERTVTPIHEDSGEVLINETPSSGEHGEQQNIEEDPLTNLVFKEGDFELKGERIDVVPSIMENYEKIEINNSTLDDLKKQYGENYLNVTEYGYLTYYEYPLYNEESYVRYSVRNSDNVVIEKMIIAYSSMESNVQLSKECDTKLENLPEKLESIKVGMTFDEVCSILGNEYLQRGETQSGKLYLWFDTWENDVELGFDNNNILFSIGTVGAYE